MNVLYGNIDRNIRQVFPWGINSQTFLFTFNKLNFLLTTIVPDHHTSIMFLQKIKPNTDRSTPWRCLFIQNTELGHHLRATNQCNHLRDCLHGGGDPRSGEVTRLGGGNLPFQIIFVLTWSRLHDRWGYPPRVTSPTWCPPPLCKQVRSENPRCKVNQWQKFILHWRVK